MINKEKSLQAELIIIVLISFLLAAVAESIIFGGIYLLLRLSGNPINENVENQHTGEPPSFYNSFEYQRPGRNNGPRTLWEHYIQDYYVEILILVIIVGIILFTLFFMLLTKKFSRYLNQITYGIQEISIGNFEHKIPTDNNSELGVVAEKLNEMSNNIYRFLCGEQQNEDVKNELITSVAHDIRTPLTSIMGYLYLVVSREDLEPQVKEHYLQIAYDKSKRLEQLTEDLFSYTKYSTDEVKMHYEKIDLVKFMEQMVDEFYPSFRDAELKYEFVCEMQEAYIVADGNTLARAIGNLVSNAIKYGRDGKLICISLKQEDNKVLVSVLNYGPVIPKEDLNHIFERFYRVENSRSEETGGTGLGLAIAKKIIELHDGTINVRSDFDGTVFEVRLKLCSDEEDKNEFEK